MYATSDATSDVLEIATRSISPIRHRWQPAVLEQPGDVRVRRSMGGRHTVETGDSNSAGEKSPTALRKSRRATRCVSSTPLKLQWRFAARVHYLSSRTKMRIVHSLETLVRNMQFPTACFRTLTVDDTYCSLSRPSGYRLTTLPPTIHPTASRREPGCTT